MDAWHARLSAVGWFFAHIEDVLSDMSVFHRVDELDQLPASVFLPRMVRLALYDGAVRHALHRDAERPAMPAPQAETRAADAPPEPVRAHTADELKALNKTREYGPLGVNQAGVFDFG
ncbi:hypothetical protein [Amycolatopsis sp. NPDC052450]|uniref:hypothetical protein n=1 Tax=Amycolatopsis sp. NPDC052450 TaxID=3363937 RepID=UPI0037CADAC9